MKFDLEVVRTARSCLSDMPLPRRRPQPKEIKIKSVVQPKRTKPTKPAPSPKPVWCAEEAQASVQNVYDFVGKKTRKSARDDQKLGIEIVKKALRRPANQITKNVGVDACPEVAQVEEISETSSSGSTISPPLVKYLCSVSE